MKNITQARMPQVVSLDKPGVMFFVRHGQCRSNVEWPIPDYDDQLDPLSELGRRQAKDCGDLIKTLLPGIRLRIWSSGLLRAIQTAEIISTCTDSILAGRDDRLNEFSSNAEDHVPFLQRIADSLADISANGIGHDERCLIVTHGHVLECLVCQSLGAPIRVVDKGDHGGQAGLATHANAGISAFYKGELLLWNAQVSAFMNYRP